MAGLVGYASSDEEDDSRESVKSQQTPTIAQGNGENNAADLRSQSPLKRKPSEEALPGPETRREAGLSPAEATERAHVPQPEPVDKEAETLIGPSRPPAGVGVHDSLPAGDDYDNDGGNDNNNNSNDGHGGEPPLSPYSAERALVRDLTLPRVPDFDIPGSPPGSPPPSAAALNKKFETFLELKRNKHTHFNARLAQSSAMRNPALMDKLMAFVGLEAGHFTSPEDGSSRKAGAAAAAAPSAADRQAQEALAAQYATTLPTDIWDPAAYPSWAYRTQLKKVHEEIALQRARGPGERVEFVAASGAVRQTGSSRNSRAGTPSAKGSLADPGAGTGKRKIRNE